jgi:tripartite-type tricarboxylate transporter receptor subunit TctC
MHVVSKWKLWWNPFALSVARERRSRRVNGLILMAGIVCAAAAHGATDKYPAKPAHLILPFGAGGSTDIIGRIFAQYFS